MKMPAVSPVAQRYLEQFVGECSRLQLRKMFGQPAAFVNGNLCIGTFGEDLFVRLSESDAAILSKIPGVRPFEPMPGRRMRQYLILPSSLLAKPVQARKWVERSVEYVLSLPPK